MEILVKQEGISTAKGKQCYAFYFPSHSAAPMPPQFSNKQVTDPGKGSASSQDWGFRLTKLNLPKSYSLQHYL